MKALIFLLLTPAWSAPLIDTDDGLKLHNHTDPYRSGKYFSNNEFVMGDVDVDGNVNGEQISIGHDLSINIDHEIDHTGVDEMDHTGVDAAIDGGWSGWSESSECSASCGAATRKWARTCTNPAPANEGKSCEGNDEETRSCDRPSCELYPADNQMAPVAIIPIALFAISQYQNYVSKMSRLIEENRKHEEVMTGLNEIKDITLSTQIGVYELQASIDFVSEQLQLDEAHTKIQTHFDLMSELKESRATKEQWDDWAKAVLDVNVGTKWALSVIHRQILSNNVIDKFKNKATAAAAGDLKRSVAGSVSDFFKLQIHYQIVGFQMVLEASTQLKYCSRKDDEYTRMIKRFNRQVPLFKNVDASMPPINYLQNNLKGGYFHMFDAKYVHLHPVEADEGQVVTGLQLYQYGNRIALKIKQGRLQGFGKIDSETWKDSSGWGASRGQDYVTIDVECRYIDLNTAQVPDGSAIVGVSFYQKGNRLSIKVKSAFVDYRNGKVHPDKWIHAPGWGTRNKQDYYQAVYQKYKYEEQKLEMVPRMSNIPLCVLLHRALCYLPEYVTHKLAGPKDLDDFVDTAIVETRPSSMLTAAALYLKGNRMAVKVCDIFKPIKGKDVSCTPNSDVRISTDDFKYQCCDGYPYAGEASQECPGDGNGPTYETKDMECANK